MNTDIHRLLDEAFAGVGMTPEAQDLKEEIRANLLARVDELEAAGVAPGDAARRAIAELGDVRELLGSADAVAPGPSRTSVQALQARHRVRLKAEIVVRIVLSSMVFVLALALAILSATAVLPLSAGMQVVLLGVSSAALGFLVAESLAVETTTNHPMPAARALGYGLATLLAFSGLGIGGLIALGSLPLWCVVFAALGVIAAIILFAFLGASQTNRHKAWVRELQRSQEPPNRFEEEPETAARFGIYTAVIWLVTFGVIVALVFTVGWWWAPLAFVGGFALMMLVLARMMFGPRKTS